MRAFLWLLLMSACLDAAACKAQQPPPPQSDFRLTATINEIMQHEVEPSADVLWNAVAEVTNVAGTEQREPKTDEDWDTVKHSAITLLEATNLILMDGRMIGEPSKKADPGGTELPPEEIQKRINADRAAFAKMAHALNDTAKVALDAINKKSASGLMEAGAAIDEACENCHLMYWYPKEGAPKPGTATTTKTP